MKTTILASLFLALVSVTASATVTVKLNDKGEAICTVTCAKGGSWSGPCKEGIQTGELYKGDKNICNGEPDLNRPVIVVAVSGQVEVASEDILKLSLGADSFELQPGEELPAYADDGRNFRCILEK